MSRSHAVFAEVLAGLNRRLVEADMPSTAVADGLAALIRADIGTAEAERRLAEEMDTLLVLYRQLWERRSPDGA